jgi:hypothetical protein
MFNHRARAEPTWQARTHAVLCLLLLLALSACGGGDDADTASGSLNGGAAAATQPAAARRSTSSSPSQAQTIALQQAGARLNAAELEGMAASGVTPPVVEQLVADSGPRLSGGMRAANKAAGSVVPVYRFFNTRTQAHFFTTSETERDQVQATLPFMTYEGPAFYANRSAATGLSPVHRFYNAATGVHFYTISESERAHVVSTLPQFSYEGVAYYASTVPAAGYAPLYRFFYTAKGFHFYTNSASEKDNIIASLPQYSFEGVGYYVPDPSGPSQSLVTSITKGAITWRFANPVRSGWFVDGSPWVVSNGAGVVITSISPTPGGARNGTMVNPVPGHNPKQCFDNRHQFAGNYDATKCIALPYSAPANTSVVSSDSYDGEPTGDSSSVNEIQVLTVLGSEPPADAFRPPYVGTSKPIWRESGLDYTKLASLPVPAGQAMPELSESIADFSNPWIEISVGWTGRYWHPRVNQPRNYGRELAATSAKAALALQLDFSRAQKRELLVKYLQYGLDIYGVTAMGQTWAPDGGHNQGRKLPMIMAGALLNDAAILAKADYARAQVFQEDRQTFYVTADDMARTNSASWNHDVRNGNARPYTAAMIGQAEWGIRHSDDPYRDDGGWTAYYRQVAFAKVFGHFVVAKLMGLESHWNHPAFFDYAHKYFLLEYPCGVMPASLPSGMQFPPYYVGGEGCGANGIDGLAAAMFKAYVEPSL